LSIPVAFVKNAVPRLVHHRMIPFDSVAFIAEAKQTLTTTSLKDDLEKFEKLNHLQVSNNKGNIYADTRVFQWEKLNRPLKFLFYYESDAKEETIWEILEGQYKDAWDVCVILGYNAVYLNSTLPIVRGLWKDAKFIRAYGCSLLKAMFFTCTSIAADFVDSWPIFWNLFRSADQ